MHGQERCTVLANWPEERNSGLCYHPHSQNTMLYYTGQPLLNLQYQHIHCICTCIAAIPWFSVSPHTAVQVLNQVCQYLFEILIHSLLTLRDDSWPDIGHGQLDARIWVILVAIEPWNEGGKVGSKLLLSLSGYAAEPKGSTLWMQWYYYIMDQDQTM